MKDSGFKFQGSGLRVQDSDIRAFVAGRFCRPGFLVQGAGLALRQQRMNEGLDDVGC